MHILLPPELEAALHAQARKRGVPDAVLVLETLAERFLGSTPPQARDGWERRLIDLAKDCGVSPSNEALGREALYE